MPRILRLTALVLALATTGACATIVQGTSQNIMVITEPPGASCVLTREGVAIARVAETPAQVTIDRSHSSITMECARAGYQPATVRMSSTVAAATFGNILAGGLIGLVVDASTGASTAYENEIRVTLTPAGALPIGTAPLGPAPGTPAAPQPAPGTPPFIEPSGQAPPPGPTIRR